MFYSQNHRVDIAMRSQHGTQRQFHGDRFVACRDQLSSAESRVVRALSECIGKSKARM